MLVAHCSPGDWTTEPVSSHPAGKDQSPRGPRQVEACLGSSFEQVGHLWSSHGTSVAVLGRIHDFMTSVPGLPGGLPKQVAAPCPVRGRRVSQCSKREMESWVCDAQPPWIQGAGELES